MPIIKDEEPIEEPIAVAEEMIDVTYPAVPETTKQIPKKEILDIIASNEIAIKQYQDNIVVRQAEIDKYKLLIN